MVGRPEDELAASVVEVRIFDIKSYNRPYKDSKSKLVSIIKRNLT
jgi:hypothetical protein